MSGGSAVEQRAPVADERREAVERRARRIDAGGRLTAQLAHLARRAARRACAAIARERAAHVRGRGAGHDASSSSRQHGAGRSPLRKWTPSWIRSSRPRHRRVTAALIAARGIGAPSSLIGRPARPARAARIRLELGARARAPGALARQRHPQLDELGDLRAVPDRPLRRRVDEVADGEAARRPAPRAPAAGPPREAANHSRRHRSRRPASAGACARRPRRRRRPGRRARRAGARARAGRAPRRAPGRSRARRRRRRRAAGSSRAPSRAAGRRVAHAHGFAAAATSCASARKVVAAVRHEADAVAAVVERVRRASIARRTLERGGPRRSRSALPTMVDGTLRLVLGRARASSRAARWSARRGGSRRPARARSATRRTPPGGRARRRGGASARSRPRQPTTLTGRPVQSGPTVSGVRRSGAGRRYGCSDGRQRATAARHAAVPAGPRSIRVVLPVPSGARADMAARHR